MSSSKCCSSSINKSCESRQDFRYVIVLFVFVSTTFFASFAHSDEAFLSGLRQRRLFRLATVHCTKRLANADLSSEETIDLLIQLNKTCEEHARYVPTAKREAIYAVAQDALEEYLAAPNLPPRSVLVQTQAALLHLSKGDIDRQEAELSGDADVRLERAKTSIRRAIRELEELEQVVARLLREQDRNGGDGLTEDELLSLKTNISLQLAHAHTSQALVYPPSSNDRVAALGRALPRLSSISQQSPRTKPVWSSIVGEVKSLRLLQEFGNARGKVAAALEATDDAATRYALMSEKLRIAIDSGRTDSMTQQLTDLEVDIPWADEAGVANLHLAMVEGYVRLFRDADRNSDRSQARLWQKRATSAVKKMESTHGAFWVRSAELLLSRTAKSGESDIAVEVLSRAADTKYRQRRFEEAKRAYLDASAKAQELSQRELAFELAYKAAAIDHQQKNHQQATTGFRKAAIELSDAAKASDAHLLSIWNQSALLKATAEKQQHEIYSNLLDEHLRLWPDNKSSNQVRVWAAALAEHSGEYKRARALLAAVPVDSDVFNSALSKLSQMFENLIGRDSDRSQRSEIAREAIAYYSRIAADQQATPEIARKASLRAARIQLSAGGNRSKVIDSLESVLGSQRKFPPEWETEARHLLSRAYLADGNFPQARHVLTLAPIRESASLLKLLNELPAEKSQAVTNLKSLVLSWIEPAKLAGSDRIAWQAIQAEVMAAKGNIESAIQQYQQFAAEHPKDGNAQETFAKILAIDKRYAKRAVEQWRVVLAGSRKKSPRYYRAKLGLAQAHFDAGSKDQAAKMVRLLKAVDSSMGGDEMKREFEKLLNEASR